MLTPCSVYSVLCTTYPSLTDIWTYHLLPFLLPSAHQFRSWFSQVVVRQLLMMAKVRRLEIQQWYRDSMVEHVRMLDVSTQSRHEYSNELVLVVEMWAWTEWFSSYGCYHFEVNNKCLECSYISNLYPTVLDTVDVWHSCKRCGFCGKPENDKERLSTFVLKGTHTRFRTCSEHILHIMNHGVIYAKDKMYYKISLYVED